MKALSKITIAAVLLLLTSSVLYLSIQPTQAQESVEKVQLAENKIRIQAGSNPIIDLELVENTAQCLVDCRAVIKLHPYQDITLPESENSDYKWEFLKASTEMPGLLSHSFELLTNVTYTTKVPILTDQTFYYPFPTNGTNITLPNECQQTNSTHYQCTLQTITGYTETNLTKEEYRPFQFWGQTLQANRDYYLKLKGTMPASLTPNRVDWIPTIKGVAIQEWEWWGGISFQRRDCFDATSNERNETLYTVGLNITYDSDMQANFNDIRFYNQNTSTLLDYFIKEKLDSAWAHVDVELDITNTSHAQHVCMYYGNSTVASLSNVSTAYLVGLREDQPAYNSSWSKTGTKAWLDEASRRIRINSVDQQTDERIWIQLPSNSTNGSEMNFTWKDTASSDITNLFGLAQVNIPFDDQNAGNYDYLGLGIRINPDTMIYIGNSTAEQCVNCRHVSSPSANTNYYTVINSTRNTTTFSTYTNPAKTTHASGSPDTDYLVQSAPYSKFGFWSWFDGYNGVDMNATITNITVRKLMLNPPTLSAFLGEENSDSTASEELGLAAIKSGIADSVRASGQTLEYHQISQVTLGGQEQNGTFDIVLEAGDQTWAFNYKTGSETFANLSNITTAFITWENSNLTSNQISVAVKDLIDHTAV